MCGARFEHYDYLVPLGLQENRTALVTTISTTLKDLAIIE